jgi:hypothetical protein
MERNHTSLSRRCAVVWCGRFGRIPFKRSPLEADRLNVIYRRSPGRALLGMALLAVGCHSSASRTPAATPHTQPPVPSSMLQQAKRAEQEGRLTEALALYESVASSRYVATPARLEALAHGAVLRLSADPMRRDYVKAQAMLNEASRLDPQFAMSVPAAALVGFLQDVQALRARAESLAAALRMREREVEQASERTDQKTATLRNENRLLRDQIKTLQAELANKEDQLRRTAEKLLNTPPRSP